MFTTKALYQGAAIYGTTTAFCAAWVCFALPVQHGKVGPFNYHRIAKRAARLPWRRLPRAL
ncbi:hypothetical protein Tdes44962_MAKER01331 [Teratosphaeria destructans]|uniref:Uncharacterized protein n=1 Tax=Teratosphaeria destructans TaxID=418781 RepID=A0A9W7T000_9PEZI|nr:hypothetical protein Tdes44962_MAKER01331 [Teratosphaeria destructans]